MILLGAVVVLGLIGGALFEIANAGRERALKIQYRDRAVASTEFSVEAIRQSAIQQLQQQAWLDVGSLDTNQTQSHGSTETGYYNLNLQATAQAPNNQILATQTHNSLQSLTAADDPFRGLVAVVDTFTVTADAQSTLSSPADERFTLPSMALTPQISVRQIPVSEFTLFSSASFQVVSPFMPIVGRIHSEGDLTIWGGKYVSIYPVTAAGNISLANNGSLFAQSGPNQPQATLPFESTTNNEWLAMSRSVERSNILSGRDLPMTMVQAADITRMTAQDTLPANNPSAQQELWRQCSRIVYEQNGEITVNTGSGVAASSKEKSAFARFVSSTNPGAPVIIFDVSKEPPSAGRNSFYISSSNPDAVVLVTNAANLPSDMAIVSPLAVAIAGGFNNQGTIRAASITAKRVSAVPPN
ncbi:MAG: hypothetical protein JO232_02875 [Verrucomicrobia bacterium]|nr:hypothetical protein [Verrucomicrobiota bacterium]